MTKKKYTWNSITEDCWNPEEENEYKAKAILEINECVDKLNELIRDSVNIGITPLFSFSFDNFTSHHFMRNSVMGVVVPIATTKFSVSYKEMVDNPPKSQELFHDEDVNKTVCEIVSNRNLNEFFGA
jgi:hypothetical protein